MKLFEVANTTWENLQIATHKSVSFTPHIVLICALQFADFLRLYLSPRTTSRTISFFIYKIFGINLIPFFDICSVLAVLSPGLFEYMLLYLGHCAVATVAVCGFGSWSLALHCGVPRQISPLTPTPSQTGVSSTISMEESIKPSSFHNPTPTANKHAVQICRFLLSAAVQTVQVSVEPHISTALKDRSVAP